MTLLETVVKLQEMEQSATPGPWRMYDIDGFETQIVNSEDDELFDDGSSYSEYASNFGIDDPNPNLVCSLRNASRAMLDVLSRFQRGDAKLLGDLIYIEEDSAKFQAGFGKTPAPMQEIIDMLKRLQEAARRMEG